MTAEKIGVWSLPHSFQVGFDHRNAIKETAVELDLGKSLPAKTNRVVPVGDIKVGIRYAGAKNILIVVVWFLTVIGGIVGCGSVNAGFRADRVFKTVSVVERLALDQNAPGFWRAFVQIGKIRSLTAFQQGVVQTNHVTSSECELPFLQVIDGESQGMIVTVEFVVLCIPLLTHGVVEPDVVAVEDVFAKLQADARRERGHQIIDLSLLVAH